MPISFQPSSRSRATRHNPSRPHLPKKSRANLQVIDENNLPDVNHHHHHCYNINNDDTPAHHPKTHPPTHHTLKEAPLRPHSPPQTIDITIDQSVDLTIPPLTRHTTQTNNKLPRNKMSKMSHYPFDPLAPYSPLLDPAASPLEIILLGLVTAALVVLMLLAVGIALKQRQSPSSVGRRRHREAERRRRGIAAGGSSGIELGICSAGSAAEEVFSWHVQEKRTGVDAGEGEGLLGGAGVGSGDGFDGNAADALLGHVKAAAHRAILVAQVRLVALRGMLAATSSAVPVLVPPQRDVEVGVASGWGMGGQRDGCDSSWGESMPRGTAKSVGWLLQRRPARARAGAGSAECWMGRKGSLRELARQGQCPV
ncbi:hypothetical protein VTI74DRAFT_3296 [Chaetomium olivicolor]